MRIDLDREPDAMLQNFAQADAARLPFATDTFAGSGHPSRWLRERKLVRRFIYRCPGCNTVNLFTDDKHYSHLAER